MLVMRRLLPILVLVLALAGCRQAQSAPPPESQPSTRPDIQVYFSPHGGCTEAIVSALNQAKQMVLVQAYSFTSALIAKALLVRYVERNPVRARLVSQAEDWPWNRTFGTDYTTTECVI